LFRTATRTPEQPSRADRIAAATRKSPAGLRRATRILGKIGELDLGSFWENYPQVVLRVKINLWMRQEPPGAMERRHPSAGVYAAATKADRGNAPIGAHFLSFNFPINRLAIRGKHFLRATDRPRSGAAARSNAALRLAIFRRAAGTSAQACRLKGV
jgi:hypothetical protein